MTTKTPGQLFYEAATSWNERATIWDELPVYYRDVWHKASSDYEASKLAPQKSAGSLLLEIFDATTPNHGQSLWDTFAERINFTGQTCEGRAVKASDIDGEKWVTHFMGRFGSAHKGIRDTIIAAMREHGITVEGETP